jgi:hypothetical protein
MRTATRIALVLTGTAMVIGVFATPSAHADRSRIGVNGINALTAQQRARPPAQLGRIDYVLATKVVSVATAIVHLSSAPTVANFDRGDGWIESEFVAATKSARIADRSTTKPSDCERDTFADQQRNASDGGRSAMARSAEHASCLSDTSPKRRTRQVVIADMASLQVRKPEAAPVVFKFEAVIKIDLAGLTW